ncbi:MAG TPA: heliorhodopsin HeR [Anaerolineaceae bacterium]|nr:heliorhodopsin HeR [Anaerolineaceae bacterium]
MAKEIAKEDVAFDNKIKKLRRFNLIMGFLHLVQSVFMFIITLVVDTPGETYPVYSNYLTFNRELGGLVADTQQIWDAPLGIGIALFLLISAVAHFFLATFGYKWYEKALKKGMNPVRFYEYALSSSLMIVLIGLLVGVNDIGAIILAFFVNASMNLFGIMMEYHNQYTKKVNWASFIFGSIAGIAPWIVIFLYFLGAVNSGDAKPPAFVYAIVPTLFVFFNIFAINMVLQYKKVGPWKDYLYGERVYIILSLAAKTTLAWLIFSGIFAPSL